MFPPNKIQSLAAPLLLIVATPLAAKMLSSEQPYLTQVAAAMDRMMKGMEGAPTGDIDRDFVAMMTPHHQGAIDMAVAELRYGSNVQLRRIAQEIIVDQQQEIAAMRMAIGQPLPPSAAAPTQSRAVPPVESTTMSGLLHMHHAGDPK